MEMEVLEIFYIILGILFAGFSSTKLWIKIVNRSKLKNNVLKSIPAYIKELAYFYSNNIKNCNELTKSEKVLLSTLLDSRGILFNLSRAKIEYGDRTEYDIINNKLYIKYKNNTTLKKQTFNAINHCIIELLSYKLSTVLDDEEINSSNVSYYQEKQIRSTISILNKLNITHIDLSKDMKELANSRKYPKNFNKDMIFKIKYSEKLLLDEATEQITSAILGISE